MKSYLDKSDFGKFAIKSAQNPELAVCHTACFFGSLPALPMNRLQNRQSLLTAEKAHGKYWSDQSIARVNNRSEVAFPLAKGRQLADLYLRT